jgi:hypothetical protein
VPVAIVRVVDGDVDQYTNYTATDEQGRFRLPHLCQGSIKIWASDENKHRREGTLRLQVPAENVRVVLGKYLVHDATRSLLDK